jgi:hypothetical protein
MPSARARSTSFRPGRSATIISAIMRGGGAVVRIQLRGQLFGSNRLGAPQGQADQVIKTGGTGRHFARLQVGGFVGRGFSFSLAHVFHRWVEARGRCRGAFPGVSQHRQGTDPISPWAPLMHIPFHTSLLSGPSVSRRSRRSQAVTAAASHCSKREKPFVRVIQQGCGFNGRTTMT